MIDLSDLDKMRDRAARLYAMVLSAREHGLGSADYLAELANEALARADEMDRRRSRVNVSTPLSSAGSIVSEWWARQTARTEALPPKR